VQARCQGERERAERNRACRQQCLGVHNQVVKVDLQDARLGKGEVAGGWHPRMFLCLREPGEHKRPVPIGEEMRTHGWGMQARGQTDG
jgi:hypothetical protein